MVVCNDDVCNCCGLLPDYSNINTNTQLRELFQGSMPRGIMGDLLKGLDDVRHGQRGVRLAS